MNQGLNRISRRGVTLLGLYHHLTQIPSAPRLAARFRVLVNINIAVFNYFFPVNASQTSDDSRTFAVETFYRFYIYHLFQSKIFVHFQTAEVIKYWNLALKKFVAVFKKKTDSRLSLLVKPLGIAGMRRLYSCLSSILSWSNSERNA